MRAIRSAVTIRVSLSGPLNLGIVAQCGRRGSFVRGYIERSEVKVKFFEIFHVAYGRLILFWELVNQGIIHGEKLGFKNYH